jgi:Tfp pilus assembly protein PilN
MRAVNLLPRDERRSRLDVKHLPLLVGVGGIVVVTLAALVLGHSAASSASEKEVRLQAVRALIARLPKTQAPTVATSMIAQERNDRTAALSAAMSDRVPFDRVLRHVALVLPEEAWLTGLRAAAPEALEPQTGTPTAPAPSAQEDLTIEGATYSQEAVARVLARLALVPALENVRLAASAVVEPSTGTQTRIPARKLVTFSITASLRTGTP